MEIFGDTATVYRDFATEAYGSACFREWALGVAGDPDVLAWLQTLPERKRQANLVFAAARWHGVPAPGPYAALRDALLGDEGPIRDHHPRARHPDQRGGPAGHAVPGLRRPGHPARSRSSRSARARGCACTPTATSSAGRSRTAARRRPTRSVPSSSARRPASCRGGPWRPVVWRAGVDLSPVDVTDDDAVRWLETMVWPEQDERRERLRRAVEIARADPPYLVRGDLLEALPAMVDQAPPDATLVVFHSAVIAYLAHADRARFAAMMTDLVADGRCHWVSNEGPRVLPDLVPPGVDVPFGRFVLAVDGRPVALTHGHGAELDWL